MFLPAFRAVVETLAPSCVLDVGAGTGHLVADIADLCNNLTMIEPDSRSFRLAMDVLKDTQVEFLCMPLNAFAESGRQFDLSIVHMVLHLVKDADVFIKDLFKCVKPGGCAVISLPHPCFSERFPRIAGYSYLNECDGDVPFRLESLDEDMGIHLHMYHRSLSWYLRCLVHCGFVVRGVWESHPISSGGYTYLDVPRYLFVDMYKSEAVGGSSELRSPLDALITSRI
jgi:SAM-dependent methyltransferase